MTAAGAAARRPDGAQLGIYVGRRPGRRRAAQAPHDGESGCRSASLNRSLRAAYSATAYLALQAKFAASSVLPLPLYSATCG
jgi:hypothetical protein